MNICNKWSPIPEQRLLIPGVAIKTPNIYQKIKKKWSIKEEEGEKWNNKQKKEQEVIITSQQYDYKL